MKERFALGFDFGTLSCRALAMDMDTGACRFEQTMEYPHGVISVRQDGSPLPPLWCLQDPDDYIAALCSLSASAAEALGKERIAAIGTDFTNCTVLPVDVSGVPLCKLERFRSEPHAWPKLWKHHAAQPYALRMEKILDEKRPDWYADYGGGVSSEWMFPKLLQIYEEAPEIFESSGYFLEAADYITLFLTGRLTRNSATLGVNAFYSAERGLPDAELLDSFSPGFGGAVLPRLGGEVLPVGSLAGVLCENAARMMGLRAGTAVSSGHGDSEAACAGLGLTEPGSMLMVMGTSTCFQMLHDEKRGFEGVCAVVRDAMIPGLTACESGQPAVGDALDWYIRSAMPHGYALAAEAEGMSYIQYMDLMASKLYPGQSGLVSLDWFNGNRSVLKNYDLRACIVGLSLETAPEGLFRSLIEATAFGARKILERHESAGIHVSRLVAAGGLAKKSPLTMQIYADVLGRDIHAASVSNASAMGACVCGAVAEKYGVGSLEAFRETASRMAGCAETVYRPRPEAAEIYDRLYGVFCSLSDFAGDSSGISSSLLEIQKAAKTAFEKY